MRGQITLERQAEIGRRGPIPVPCLLLALVAGMLLIPAGTASAAGWLPQVNASPVVSSPSPADYMSLQDVAVDSQGNAVAVWVQSTISGPRILKATTRPAGGAWSAPVVISAANEDKLDLQLVVSPDGDATVTWIGYGSELVLRTATRPAGGEWSEPEALSDVEKLASEPDVVIDESGDLAAIWREDEGEWEEGVVLAATRTAGDEWSEPVELSDDTRVASSPKLAVDPGGNVTAVWVLNTGNRGDGVVQSKTLPAGGDWSEEPVDVSGEQGLASVPRIAIDAQGDATAVWKQQDIAAPSGFRHFVQTAQRVDGSWSEPLSLSREDGIANGPELTVDPAGNATALWSLTVPLTQEPRRLQGRMRTPDGEWSEPFNLVSKPNGALEPGESDYQVVADPQGNVTAVWTAWSVPTYVVRSAHYDAELGWSVPVTLSVASGYSIWPRLTVDPQGHATVVWSGFQGSTHAVRSRVLDPIPPELDDLEVPETGMVGQPVAMSVDPFDLWSPVAISWNFGDGSSGTGTAVSHCYGSAGERTVAVTGTDLAANAVSESRSIMIEPDPTLAPGVDPCRAPDPPGPTDPFTPADPSAPSESPSTNPNPAPPAPACVVPKLAGKTLARAKTALKAANCKLGKVHKPKPRKGQGQPALAVKASTPAAGTSPANGKVNLRLGPKL